MSADADANDIDRIQDELVDKVFELYAEKSKNFYRIFSVLIAFALIFLFIILLPYASILEKNNNYSQQLKDLPQIIAEHQVNINTYKAAENGTLLLKNTIDMTPNNMRDAIGGVFYVQATIIAQNVRSYITSNHDSIVKVSEPLSNLMQYNKTGLDNSSNPFLSRAELFPECEGSLYAKNIFVDCEFEHVILKQIKYYNQIFSQYILGPLQRIDKKSQVFDLQALKNGFAELNETSYKVLMEHSHILSDYMLTHGTPNLTESQKVVSSGPLRQFVTLYNASLQGTRFAIENQLKNQRLELNKFKADEIQLLQNQIHLQKAKNELQDKLNQIQFPFGKLPVNLDEAIGVFPLVLAIGFLVCASILSNTIHLRKDLHDWYHKKDPSQTRVTNQMIANIAPLWIDPIASNLNQILKFIIFLFPLLIFILSWYLIAYYLIFNVNLVNTSSGGENLLSTFPGGKEINLWMFSGLYTLSLGFFIYGNLSIIRDLRHY